MLAIFYKAQQILINQKNTFWTLSDQAIVSGSNFLISILLAKVLGLKEFGIYSLAMIVILFANMIQQSAINAPMMSIGPKQKKEDISIYYGSVLIQALAFAIISSIIVFASVNILSKYIDGWNLLSLALPLAINAFFVQIQDFIRRYFFTIGKPTYSFISDFIRYISLMLSVILLYFGFSRNLVSADIFWISSFFTLISIVIFIIHFIKLSFSFSSFKKYLKRHWIFSKWLAASSIIQWFTGNIFTIVAGGMVGPSAVGALKAAQSLLGITHIIFLALENIVPIKAAKLYSENKVKEMVKYLIKTGAIGFSFVAFISIVLIINPDFWFGLIFGEEYISYSYLIKWIAIYYLSLAFSVSIRFGLRTIEKSKILFHTYILLLILSLISVQFVIENLGILGVAIASIVSQMIFISINFCALKKGIDKKLI